MKKLLVFFVIVFLGLSLGYAQTGQTGQIIAKVTDGEGVPIPGVLVSISSPGMVIAVIERITNDNGVARFPSLNPGIYQIKSEVQGLNSNIRKGVVVNAGITISVDVIMNLSAIAEEISVVGQSPTIDKLSTTKTSTLDKEFLAMMPATRNITAVFNMTPGVVAGTASGSTVRDNAYLVDGVNITDSTTGVLANDLSLDTADEISVQSGGLSAEYGQVRGAVVNIVSKSGGNEFHGKVDMFYRGKAFQSDNTKNTPLAGSESGLRYEIEPGISLGGPIIKDKLWFFVNASFYKQQYYVPGFPYDKPTETPVSQTKPYPYFKLSFQPNQDNKFIISYGFANITNPNNYASRYHTEDTTTDLSADTHIVNFVYTRFFNSNFLANLKASAWLSGLYRYAKVIGPNFYEETTYLNSNSLGWDDNNPRRHFSVEANSTNFLDNFLGSHELKIGASFRKAIEIRELTMHPLEGTPWTFINTWNGVPDSATYYYDSKWENLLHDYGFYINDSWNVVKNLTLNLGLRADINQGLWPPQNENEEYYELPVAGSQRVDRSIKETMLVYNWKNLSPRLGFLFDIFGNSKTLLKGSYSKYVRGNINTWIGRGNPNGWTGYSGDINPDYSLKYVTSYIYAGKKLAPQYGYKDYDFKSPYTNELTVSLERELAEDWSVSLRYINKKDKNMIDDADASTLDLDKFLATGELDWIGYTPVQTVDPITGSNVTFYNKKSTAAVAQLFLVNPPNATMNYSGIEFTINKRYAKNWQLSASYTYAKSTGLIPTDFSATSAWGTGFYQNANAHVNAVGRFPFESRHQVKLTMSVKMPFGINLGTFTSYMSGGRYTRTIESRFTNLKLWQGNQTIYAEELGSRGFPALFLIDLRAEKEIRIGKSSIGIFGEAFNLLNGNKATNVIRTSNNPNYTFEEMTSIQAPRIFRIGARFEW